MVEANPFVHERDRWFLWTVPLFALGIAIYFDRLTEPKWYEFGLLVTAAVFIRFLVRNTSVASLLLTAFLIVLAGGLAAKLRTDLVLAPILPHTVKAATVEGLVERTEHRSDGSTRMTIRVLGITELPPESTPKRARIYLRKRPVDLQTGDAIRLTARLAAPSSPAMPRGYDFARAAYFQGLGAIGYALSQPQRIEISHQSTWWFDANAWLQRLRRTIGNRIEAALSGEVGIMANALMTGERSGISPQINELYRDAGIFHILSISGLHMAIMGGSVFITLRLLLASVPALALRYPIKKWAACAAAIATFAYLMISGGAHPTVRSFIMILIMFVAIVLDRPAIALRNVAFAAWIILALMPESLFNAGFQLSFAAVIALIAAYEGYQIRQTRRRQLGFRGSPPTGGWRWVRGAYLLMMGTIATTLIAGLATAPFAAFHFHTSQQYSVLTNMLAIPVSNFIVMPAALAAFIAMPVGLEASPLALMGIGIRIMTWSAEQVVALPGAVTTIPAFPQVALQLIIFGGLWLCIWRRQWRWLGLLPIIAGIYVGMANTRYPAALIGRDGKIVALRDNFGRLAAIKSRGGSYEYGRWLERDGDRREPDEAWNKQPFRCDLNGCTGKIGQHVIAMPRSPAALVDDCRKADLIVISFPKPPSCITRANVIDFQTLRRHGNHAIYVQRDGSLRIETVEEIRGNRPWTAAITSNNPAHAGRKRKTRNKPISINSPRLTTDDRLRQDLEVGRPLYWYDR